MYNLPTIFQIRKDIIISYTDFSSLTRKYEKKEIIQSGTYTQSAQRKFKKYLQLWSYSLSDTIKKFSFITLTISSTQKKEINYTKYLKTLIEKLNTRYGYFNYAWKIEYQKNGNIHFHIIIDTEMDWKIIRSQWNKIQHIHVDEYQNKMKSKYKKGYYFDTEMKDKNNETVNEETQYKRYIKGNKANWRNPNSTDVKIETTTDGIGNYINKYISKNEEETEENNNKNKTKRFYGLSDNIRKLKYATLTEMELSDDEFYMMIDNKQKEIKDKNNQTIWTLNTKLYTETIRIRESEQLQKNKDILNTYTSKTNSKLIEKELKLYGKLFA